MRRCYSSFKRSRWLEKQFSRFSIWMSELVTTVPMNTARDCVLIFLCSPMNRAGTFMDEPNERRDPKPFGLAKTGWRTAEEQTAACMLENRRQMEGSARSGVRGWEEGR